MEFLALFLTDWNFHLILPNIWIQALFLQTLEFLSYPSIANVILALSFQTMEFWPIIYTRWFFLSHPSKHWDSGPIFMSVGIMIIWFQRMESYSFFINTGILALSFQTLEFLYCPSKHWNSGSIFYTLHFGLILRKILLWTID